VARVAVDAAERGEFLVIPMAHARWAWRLKRLAPRRYFDVSRLVLGLEARRRGVDPLM
jgi:hypothetical protein